ncbi:hypothetical protein [Roseomonas sp. HF4]|uniref:hypothetical protein n=1 Tax=Roseomonas sp. HF4 TaxID=2562313 RepID=UPI0010BFD49D|nr:hypothetical protein [Roseomonas sp. HF4]
MSHDQSLPRSIAVAIVEVVSRDAGCQRLIPEVSPYAIGQNAAGSLRNLTNMTMEGMAWAGMKVVELVGGTPTGSSYAKDYWEQRGMDQSCTGIASATDAAINAAVAKGDLPRWVLGANPISRRPEPGKSVLAHHDATAVTVGDGKTYVFDWHGTLSLRNPLISRSAAEWRKGDDRYRVLFSVFQGWG